MEFLGSTFCRANLKMEISQTILVSHVTQKSGRIVQTRGILCLWMKISFD